MPKDDRLQFTVENATIIWPNFSGAEDRFNAAGESNRYFHVVLDEKTAREMEKDGWNIKWPKDRPGVDPEEDTRLPTLKIVVKYENRAGKKVPPPRVTMITSNGRVPLGKDNIDILDYADLETVDFIAVASYWEVNGKTGINAYLKTMYATVAEDELERKYGMANDFVKNAMEESDGE